MLLIVSGSLERNRSMGLSPRPEAMRMSAGVDDCSKEFIHISRKRVREYNVSKELVRFFEIKIK